MKAVDMLIGFLIGIGVTLFLINPLMETVQERDLRYNLNKLERLIEEEERLKQYQESIEALERLERRVDQQIKNAQ